MQLTPLGTSACVPNPTDACSGHLLRHGSAAVLLDCGPGVVGNLRRHIPDFRELSAIVISHMHEDHFLDLFSLRCGLKYLPAIAGGDLVKVPLYLPPGGKALIVQLQQVLLDHRAMHPVDAGPGGACGSWHDVFQIAEYSAAAPVEVDGLRFEFAEVVHDIPAWGIRTAADGLTFAYSGDSGPCDGLVDLARGVDLFLCEAGSPENPDLEHSLAGSRVHLSGAEAGATAAKAGVKRLLLTHLWSEYDAEARLRAASASFSGPVTLARPNDTYSI